MVSFYVHKTIFATRGHGIASPTNIQLLALKLYAMYSTALSLKNFSE